MPDCKLSTDFSPASCTDLGRGGVSGVVYNISYNDWLTATVAETDNTITDIALTNTGAKAVKWELPRGSAVPSSEFVDNAGGRSGFTHSVQSFIPVKDQVYKTEVSELANYGRTVQIVILDDDVTANIYGADVGMKLTAYEELPNDPSIGGGIRVTVSTPTDVTPENLPPKSVFITDRATTLAMLESLLTPVA